MCRYWVSRFRSEPSSAGATVILQEIMYYGVVYFSPNFFFHIGCFWKFCSLVEKDKIIMKFANKSTTINKANLKNNILPLLRENIEKRKIVQEILLHQLAFLFNTRNY